MNDETQNRDEATLTYSSAAAPAIASILGYRISGMLARGGMGEVYLAEDENLRRPVAIKIILAELSDDQQYRRRFTQEARTVASFQHPNIVTIHASGFHGENQYIVMEYVAGGTLHDRIEKAKLGTRDAIDIGVKMADALAYAHEREVIHRDIKPRNVLVRPDGTPVLTDFGVAKSMAGDSQAGQETAIGVVVGSLRYMSPEQARGDSLTNKVDIYSFALVLYEMLTGELPRAHPVVTKEDKQALVLKIGPVLGGLLGKCLAPTPHARPTAAECRDFLRADAANQVGRRRRVAVGTIVAALVVISVLATIGWVRREGSKPAPGAHLTLEHSPLSARLFLDGRPVDRLDVEVSDGPHDVTAVSPGYYGAVERVVTRSREPYVLKIALSLTQLPSREETQRFLQLADADALTDSQVSSVMEPTLHTVLKVKQSRAMPNPSMAQDDLKDIELLREHGDARAAVASYLIDTVSSGQMGPFQIPATLTAASEAGDAMASLFLALAYRTPMEAGNSRAAANDPQFQTYCRYMRLAAQQGWSAVAADRLIDDHCAS